MQTKFRKAVIPAEIRTLVTFDHKVFPPSDWFEREDWQAYESWWMIVDNKKVGCCAFKLNVDFQEDVRNPPRRASLYVASTGILPRYRSLGFGKVLKSWQISYARYHRFTRIVTNTRESNQIMIGLNRKFGFKVLRTTSGYYEDPCEPTVVMELNLLDDSSRSPLKGTLLHSRRDLSAEAHLQNVLSPVLVLALDNPARSSNAEMPGKS